MTHEHPNDSKHDNNIDALRFFGAFLVLFGHAFELCYGKGGGFDPISAFIRPFTAYHERLPGLGVAMFFVLSGYLVTRSLQRRQNLLAYLEARVLRIYPALWVVLLLSVLVLGPLVSVFEVGDYFSRGGTWRYLTHNAWLYPDVAYKLPGVFVENPRTGVNGSLWTLPVEVRMYVIVALFGVLGLLRARWLFNVAALLVVGWYLLLPDSFVLLHQGHHERLGVYFLLGALFYINADRVTYHWLGVLLTASLAWVSWRTPYYNAAFSVALSYLVLFISFHPRLRLPDLAKHGDFSYGMYLYAFPLTQLVVLAIGPGNPWLVVAAVLPLTVLFAVGSWWLVEKPSLRLKGVLSSRASVWAARLRPAK